MDNRIISIQSEGKRAFDLAIQLLFDNAPGGKSTYFLNHPEKGLILFWHHTELPHPTDKNARLVADKLPYSMNWKAAAEMAWGWLEEREDKEYRDYCDHDGSNGHGFRVYNEDWGKVAGSDYAICAVLPVWAWYGK